MHKIHNCLILLVVGIFMPAQCECARAEFADGEEESALVSGEVIAIEDVAGRIVATVKITQVYSGPKSLKGLAFFDHSADGGSAGNAATPLLKAKETGLWMLCINQNSGTWFVCGRFRKDHTANYDQRVKWAEAVGRLSKLDATKRLKLAQELCGDKTPEIAQYSISLLLGAKPEDARLVGVPEFLDGLPKNREVSPSALARADRLWFDRDGKEWLNSDRRKSLLARFIEPLKDADAAEVIEHVVTTRYLKSPEGVWFTAQEAAALLTKIATDPRQPKTVRRAVVARVVKVAENAGARPDFTFDILLAVLRQGTDDGVRLQAAQGCVSLVRGISGPQLDIILELVKDERNADVAKALQTAIDKSKAK